MPPLQRRLRLRQAVPALVALTLSLGAAPAAHATTALARSSASPTTSATPRTGATVLVTGSAAAVRAGQRLVGRDPGFTSLPVIGGFAVEASTAERGELIALGLHVTDNAPVTVADADWGEDSHDASAVYPQVDGATSAWADGIDGSGVSVAVIDTGISDKGDLAGKVIDGYDFSGEGSYTTDSFGHGTFVAGTIAGSGAGSDGAVKGVAPGADLVALKVAGADGSSDVLRVITAVQWAVNHAAKDNIRVLNLSLGTDSTQDWRIDPLDAAVEGAWRAGLVVTVAAGNNGSGGIGKPADDPYVITVGASDDATTTASDDDTIGSFSSVGPTAAGLAKPDLVAPGTHIVSSRSPGSTVDTTYPGSEVGSSYFRGSGTSFAAPQVAGAVALLLQQRPNLSNNHIKGMLLRSAIALPDAPATAQGKGALNIPGLLGAASVPSPNKGLDSSDGSGSVAASQGSLADAGKPTGGDGVVWNSTAWNSTAWNSTAWNDAAWNSTAWNSTAWNSTAWNSTAWNSTAWNSTAWNSTAWNSTAWNSTAWNSTAWNSTAWTSTAWTSMGFWSTAWN
ncbi:S8 family serine peptidase [Nocardioides sp. BP30]|uniref:S8 family peptidase n=1 Tax=Nocardioides sp. BP30 TaxID=3036374 RepID=UPI002468AC35|nr:S8 family peptidase [Nocardioides sp. BP30]WGL52247.1 S8 family serine peptidase [Nocardioides sp. BP30]